MKKRLFLFALALCLLLSLTACGHEHSFTWVTENGTHQEICSDCGVPRDDMGAEAHDFQNGETCSVCQFAFPAEETQGLAMTPSSDGSYYTVTGMGDATGDYIRIPGTHNGQPVIGIDDYAFSNNNSALYFRLPESMIKIGREAFMACHSLMGVYIPNSVTSIGENAFSDCDSMNYLTLPEKLTVISYGLCNSTNNLHTLRLPKALRSIGDYAFLYCPLKELVFPETLTEIGTEAFAHLEVSAIHIPAGVKKIGLNAFNGEILTALTVDPANQNYRSENNCILELATGTLLLGCSGTTGIPASVTAIAPYAFHGSGITALTVPGTVKTVGDQAFAACLQLTALTLEEGVESIGEAAFLGDYRLTAVTLPDSLTHLGKQAFYECRGLETATLGGGLTVLNTQTFYACTALRTVYLPAGLKTVEPQVFSGCDALTALHFAEPNGWRPGEDFIFVTPDLSDPAIAAEAFVATYPQVDWHKR